MKEHKITARFFFLFKEAVLHFVANTGSEG